MSIDARLFPVDQFIGNTTWMNRGLLGEGGMGIVLDVEKPLPVDPADQGVKGKRKPGICAAMKLVRPEFARRPDLVALFMNEIRTTNALSHRHIVSVMDAGVLPGGMPFVVTERLEGTNLRRLLRKVRGPLGANLAHLINTQVCDAIHRAHTNSPSIVHRDLKPENVFLHQPSHEPPVVKVLDWGVAALLDGMHDSSGFVGTPMYMAPEQIRGESVTPMADIYAAALMLYEMLTGRLPFDIDYTSQAHVEEAHRSLPPIPPSRFAPWMPPKVEAHLLRGLAKDPAQRPRSAYAFAVEFFELQFVDDGKRPVVVGNVNNTAPDLATLISQAKVDADPGLATDPRFTPPEKSGRTLEPANPSEEPPPPERPATLPDHTQRPSMGIPTEKAAAPAVFGDPAVFGKGGTFRMPTAAAQSPPVAPPVARSAPPVASRVLAHSAAVFDSEEDEAIRRPGMLPAFPVRPAAGAPPPPRPPPELSPTIEAEFFAVKESVSSDAATSQSLPRDIAEPGRKPRNGGVGRSIALVTVGAAIGTLAVSVGLFVSRSSPLRPQGQAPPVTSIQAPIESTSGSLPAAAPVAVPTPPLQGSAVVDARPAPGPSAATPTAHPTRAVAPQAAAARPARAAPPKPSASTDDDGFKLLYQSL